jgi:hypothetical protein
MRRLWAWSATPRVAVAARSRHYAMWVGEAAHFSTQLRYLLIRKTSVKALLGVATFPSHGCLGKNVTLEASNFNNTQQLSTNGLQQVQ